MSGSIKKIISGNPTKEGSAISYVNPLGGYKKIEPQTESNRLANSGVMDNRFTQVTYYTA